jgi:hypothetical protein
VERDDLYDFWFYILFLLRDPSRARTRRSLSFAISLEVHFCRLRFSSFVFIRFMLDLFYGLWVGVHRFSNDIARGATPSQTAGGFTEFSELVLAKLPDAQILFVSILRSPYQVWALSGAHYLTIQIQVSARMRVVQVVTVSRSPRRIFSTRYYSVPKSFALHYA